MKRLPMRKIRDALRLRAGGLVDAGDRREPGRRAVDAERLSEARRARRSRLAAARGSDRCGARGDAVPAGGRRDPAGACPARLADDPPRAPAQGRDAGAPVGGVPGGASRRLRLQPVLRALPALGGPARADDAPAPRRRRADVRRLCRRDASGDRRRDRHGAPGPALRRGARRVELHVRRGDLDAEPAGLDRLARPGARLVRRRAGADRVGQPQGRRHQGLLLRARGQPDLRRHGGALRHGRGAGAALQAARQGQGRGRRPGGAALDRGAAAQPAVLLARRAERGDPRPGRCAQRPRHPPPRRQPPAAVRGPRAPGAEAAARGRPTNTRSGRSAPSGSTTTSRSTAITTRCPTGSCARRSGRA